MKYAFTRMLGLMVLFALMISGLALAQTTKGTIAGVVTDQTGAVVSGATVTVTPTAGGEARTTKTGDKGEYRVEALNPGLYTLAVSGTGFQSVTVQNVVVATSSIASHNVQMPVASGTESVTVEARSETIQTESGELSKTIATKAVKDLPYGTLNPYQLAVTLPGVTTVQGREDFTNGTSFSVNGLRTRANNFLIDGFDNNDNGIGGQAFQPNNTEAVQEVTVLTNSYAAEFGRGGGSVSNLTFRSGSNNLHGAAWEQYSGSRLNALTTEESNSGLTRPGQFVNNIFGFRLGGPVKKNKLYYFGTVQWNRFYGAQAASQLTIPTEAGFNTLNGLAASNSNVALLLNSLGTLRGVNDGGPQAPAAVQIGARAGCAAPCPIEMGLFTRSDSGASLSREWTVRTDYTTGNDSFFVRYTDSKGSLTPDLFANPAALPSMDTEQGGPARVLGTMWAHTFTPTVLNEFRFSAQTINFTFGPTAATLANPNANLPSIAFTSGITPTFAGYSQSTFPQGRGHKVYQFQDAVSFTRGSHNMKIGADLAVLSINDQIPFNFNGFITISGGGSCAAIGITTNAGACNALTNYIDNFLGPTGTVSKNFGNPRVSVPTNQQGYYFQDSWKATSNLTLTYGVRYEYQPPDASNVLAYPAIDRATVGTEPLQTRHEVKPDRNNFAPRVGFAYSPKFWTGLFGHDATVIRGGYGMFYDSFFTNISNNTASATPNTLGGTINGGAGRGPSNPLGLVAGITPTISNTAARTTEDQNLVQPITHQWNVNIQRSLPWKFTAEAAYVGTRGERLFVNEQLNPRVPTFNPLGGSPAARLIPTRGSIVIRGNRGDSNYHGLQTSLSRNAGNLSLRASYTYAKSLDNMSEVFASSGGASRWEILNNPRSDRGPSAFDRRHRLAISYVYEVPTPWKTGFLGQVFGGWSTSGIVSFQTGAPETIYLSGWDQNGDGEGSNDRPSLGNPNAKIDYSDACLDTALPGNTPLPCSGVGFDDGTGTGLTDWNTGAAGAANLFRYIVYPSNSGINGNISRNNFRYPGRQDWNLSAVKRFRMPYAEGHNLEFRADFFNAFNHPNTGISSLNGNVNSGTFLNIDATRRGGRNVVLWMKYSF